MTDLPKKHLFDLPDGVIYLDGNSLGPLPRAVPERVEKALRAEWGGQLIRAWVKSGWMAMPGQLGDRIAPLIGAASGSVMVGDTLSLKVWQAVAAAMAMRPDRRIILSDTGNFPTDLYMANSLARLAGQGHEIKLVAPQDIAGAIDDKVAAVMLTHADYRTGRLHDMADVTRAAHGCGAVMIWDLAHSAGALPLDLAGSGCEFAVGCTYKYLNAGPGAPAFIYIRPDLIDEAEPVLSGWMGHAAPFDMAPDYQPAQSIERMRVGTPPVIQMAMLEAALDVWDGVDLAEVRAASIQLSELFIQQVEARCPQLELASPRSAASRGSQVSFRFEAGYQAMQALIAKGVIGDFRPPDIMRFGFTPLYLDEGDILAAVDRLEQVMTDELWRDPAYQTRGRVT